MTSKQDFKNEDSSPNQFVKLFKDENRTNLLGWLNTYCNPESSSIVEQWSLVEESDLSLYNCSYWMEQVENAPNDFLEWKKIIEKEPDFTAYINRVSDCYSYESFIAQNNRQLCAQTGIRMFCIYNGAEKDNKDSLVQITLQTPSVFNPKENAFIFEQVSLMLTLEAPDRWFTFSEEILIKEQTSFGDFINKGGCGRLFLDTNKIAFINFERVFSYPDSPLNLIQKS